MPKLNRREFIRSMGLAAMFTPFLSLAKRAPARAAAPGKAKYLLLFYTNGTDPSLWTPTGSSENQIVFAPGSMVEPLSALKANLVLIEKLSSKGTADNHAAPGGLTGQGYSGQSRISIDQYIADKIKAAGVVTDIPSVILGGVKNEQQTAFYRDNQTLSPIFSPSSAFDTIFGGNQDAAVIARRRSSIEVVNSELAQLSNQLGPQERRRLKLHVDSVASVKARLDRGSAGGGTRPTDPAQDLLASSMHLDTAISAFAADTTRVASVQFGHHQNTQVSIAEIGNAGNWHNDFMHADQPPRSRLINIDRWIAKEFVRAAQKLKSLPSPEGGGTLFDQTLMVWARDMGDSVNHDGSNMRFVFSGGAGGFLKTAPNGRYINGEGEAHQRALITCASAMGVTDFGGFGDAAQSRLPLDSIGQ
jgi:Protein of unknown function (DUF1552)